MFWCLPFALRDVDVIVGDGVDTKNLYLAGLGTPETTAPMENDFEADEFYDDEDYAFDEDY